MQGGDYKIVYKDLSYKIVGLCFKAHDILGRFCREKQYCDILENLFKQEKIKYEREKNLDIILGESKIGGNRVDFIIEDKILFDAKAKNFITKEDYRQMKRYLQATGLKLCIVINFREISLKPKRILNSLAKE
ncbi:MAG: GxxExxY protein [Patescibacteria group bacterium]|jgi:GxxExxY protein